MEDEQTLEVPKAASLDYLIPFIMSTLRNIYQLATSNTLPQKGRCSSNEYSTKSRLLFFFLMIISFNFYANRLENIEPNSATKDNEMVMRREQKQKRLLKT